MNPPQVYMCSPSWTLLPPPSPFHPTGSSQCTSPKHPVSCIEPGLSSHFIHDILHVSMPFSQIFPPSPSPTESIRLFYTWNSFLNGISMTENNLTQNILDHWAALLLQFSSGQFSCSVVSDSLRHHELQHARLQFKIYISQLSSYFPSCLEFHQRFLL